MLLTLPKGIKGLLSFTPHHCDCENQTGSRVVEWEPLIDKSTIDDLLPGGVNSCHCTQITSLPYKTSTFKIRESLLPCSTRSIGTFEPSVPLLPSGTTLTLDASEHLNQQQGPQYLQKAPPQKKALRTTRVRSDVVIAAAQTKVYSNVSCA